MWLETFDYYSLSLIAAKNLKTLSNENGVFPMMEDIFNESEV